MNASKEDRSCLATAIVSKGGGGWGGFNRELSAVQTETKLPKDRVTRSACLLAVIQGR